MKKLLIGVCLLGVVGYFGSKFYLHDKVSRNLDMVLVAARPYVDIEYKGVSSTLTGELSVDGITARFAGFQDPVHIQSVSIVTPGYFHLLSFVNLGGGSPGDFEIPDALAVAFRGISVDVDADYMSAIYAAQRAQANTANAASPTAACGGNAYGFSGDMLDKLGYETLVVDAAAGYRQDDNRMVFDMSTHIEDMYDMTFVMTFDSMPSPQSIAMGTFRPRLVSGRMEYVDRSLEDRVMKLCTETGQLSVDAVIDARVDALQAAAAKSGIEFDTYVIDPYVEFLNGKDTFIITAQPIEPVDLAHIGLYKPSDVPALLNLAAEAR